MPCLFLNERLALVSPCALPLSPQPPAPARRPAPWTRALPLLAPSSHTFRSPRAHPTPFLTPRPPSLGARPASSPCALPLPALSRPPAPCPLRARFVPVPCSLRARSLALPGAGCGGSRSARSWRSAGAAAGRRVPRARVQSMSRRRRRPRAAWGPTAARGLRGSYAGPDRGRQRPPDPQSLRPSLPPAGRPLRSPARAGRGVRGSRVPPGAAVVGPGRGLPARVRGRALRRACGSPVRSSPELRPGLDSARTPQSPAPVGHRAVSAWAWRELTWQAGVGSRARVACPGPGVEEGAGKSEELGLRSWKFPFACLHSGPRGGISRPCCVARNWGVSAAFEESRLGRDAPLCTVGKGHLKDRALFAPGPPAAGNSQGQVQLVLICACGAGGGGTGSRERHATGPSRPHL